MNTNNSNSKDPIIVMALKVLKDEHDLERLNFLKANLIQNIRDNRGELVELMIWEGVDIIDGHVAKISLNSSRYVEVINPDLVPGEFLVDLGNRINKRKIHRVGVCLPEVLFLKTVIVFIS